MKNPKKYPVIDVGELIARWPSMTEEEQRDHPGRDYVLDALAGADDDDLTDEEQDELLERMKGE